MNVTRAQVSAQSADAKAGERGGVRLVLAGGMIGAVLLVASLVVDLSGGNTMTMPQPSLPPMPSGFPTELPSGFPTDLPSGLPTELPSGLPTDLPSFPTDLPSLPGGGS
ncbi:hypothetical protein [Streptacidiphilus pinicola]|uniref:hypothetical protein n=1 Tax=Streptacidiphilus pinicola TaxID=2219663 RepID=UPI001FB34762|nr:hypothetical protein [Streptacidiphilus pinicola]